MCNLEFNRYYHGLHDYHVPMYCVCACAYHIGLTGSSPFLKNIEKICEGRRLYGSADTPRWGCLGHSMAQIKAQRGITH